MTGPQSIKRPDIRHPGAAEGAYIVPWENVDLGDLLVNP